LPRETRSAGAFALRIASLLMYISRWISSPPRSWSCAFSKYGRGVGSAGARANALQRNGFSASNVTIQGEIVVAKLFDRNGPSGWYSQACTSRADQSFSSTTPNK